MVRGTPTSLGSPRLVAGIGSIKENKDDTQLCGYTVMHGALHNNSQSMSQCANDWSDLVQLSLRSNILS